MHVTGLVVSELVVLAMAICRGDLLSYFGAMRDLARLVVECLTEGLGLEPDTFTRLETDDAICNARVNHYPACPDPTKVFGIPAHTDPQMLSIGYQDEVGGLQVLKGDKWIGVRPDDSTFIVNLADTFQVRSSHLHLESGLIISGAPGGGDFIFFYFLF
jgi:isopenicillin N synthase-like dioxygenase